MKDSGRHTTKCMRELRQ